MPIHSKKKEYFLNFYQIFGLSGSEGVKFIQENVYKRPTNENLKLTNIIGHHNSHLNKVQTTSEENRW